ncbi:MAG: hypothetical protein ACNS63_11915 [Candidatus Nitrospinota bacterium M3_3B_026]
MSLAAEKASSRRVPWRSDPRRPARGEKGSEKTDKPQLLYILPPLFVFVSVSFYTASPWPGGQDGVNLVLGVADYDVAFHQPHFPGYPVYMAAGKLLNRLTASPEAALAALSIISGAAALALVFLMAGARLGAAALALSLAANPVFFELSHKIYTEAFGGALLLAAAFTLGGEAGKNGRGRWSAFGLALGLTLGVRLSWWPYAMAGGVFAWRHGGARFFIAGLSGGVFAWLAPQLLITGPGGFFEAGLAHVAGHFTTWGGAATSVNGAEGRIHALGERLLEVFGYTGNGSLALRLPWMIAALSAAALAWRDRNEYPDSTRFFAAASLFYLAWAAVGQNVEKARHFLPLVFAAVMLFAPLARRRPGTAALLAAGMWLALGVDYTARTTQEPPSARLFEWVDTRGRDAVFYMGSSERLFDLYRAGAPVVSVENADGLENTVKSAWPRFRREFVLDDIGGLKMGSAHPVAVFAARRGDPIEKTLRLYEIRKTHAR